MKLSVIIVNYNVAYFLEQCLGSVRNAVKELESLYGQGCAEIFVIDNNSIDNSVEMVKKLFPEVICIANHQNLGFSKANNQGMEMAKGEYFLLLNPDTVVEHDTFRKCCVFMDAHPQAGGLGVKMIDGKGNFLPESKRGLPTPWVAFYKIFGLSRLFPKSKKFGQYHLSFLKKDELNQVDILSGAFMWMRKSVLEQVGLLDEQFFMYGEDIDLSWRIIKGGYHNYYFPHTRIIHYKGESTKKSSVNYVFIFYRAMIIFAQKHFSGQNAKTFSFLIHLAIYLRASMAIVNRFLKKIFIPVVDALLILGGLILWKEYWEQYHIYIEGGSYPEELTYAILPAYTLTWVLMVMIGGGYKRPFKSVKILRGIAWGTMLILGVYALLPETLRFSRALILLGTAHAIMTMLLTRLIFHYSRHKNFNFDTGIIKRLAIVGEFNECQRVEALIRSTGSHAEIMGFILTQQETDGLNPRKIGEVSNLEEIIAVYKIQEIIFCGKDLESSFIIDKMAALQSYNLEFKIAPPESEFIIGSNSIHQTGEMYVVGLNAISKPENRRKKRMVDLLTSCFFLITLPFNIWLVRNKQGYLRNLGRVLAGKMTWVGYHPSGDPEMLPKLKKTVLNPSDATLLNISDPEILKRLNYLYAKDYQVGSDLDLIRKNFKNLGKE